MACGCGCCNDSNVACNLSADVCCGLQNSTITCDSPAVSLDDLTAANVHPAVTSLCAHITVDPVTQVLECDFDADSFACWQTGLTAPAGDPVDTDCLTIHQDTATGCIYIWNVTDQAWGPSICSECCVTFNETTTDPNGDGILPQDPDNPEILYNAFGCSWNWDTVNLTWVQASGCMAVNGPFVVNGQDQDCGELWTYDVTAGATIEQLPSAVARGNGCQIGYKVFGAAPDTFNNLTLLATGGQTIDGDVFYELSNTDETIWIVSDGSNWIVKYNYDPSATCPCPIIIEGPFVAPGNPIDCGDLQVYAPVGADITEALPVIGIGNIDSGCQIGYQNISASFDLILQASGIDTINGAADYTIKEQFETVWLVADVANNNWIIKYNYDPSDMCPCPIDVSGPFVGNGQDQDCGGLWTYDVTAGAVIEQLPSAVTRENGCQIGYKVYGAAPDTFNNLTLLATGGQTIDGDVFYELSNTDETIWIVSDGSNWIVKYNYDPSAACPCPIIIEGPFVAPGNPINCGYLQVYAPVGADITEALPVVGVGNIDSGCQIGYQNTSAIFNLILQASGIDTINGAADYTIEEQFETVWLVADVANNNWIIKYSHYPKKPELEVSVEHTVAGFTPNCNGVEVYTTTVGAVSETLPSAVTRGSGCVIHYKLTTKGFGDLTLNGFGGETIDGAVALVINTTYDSVTLVSDGSDWLTI